MGQRRRTSLSAEDWAAAALDAFGSGGLAAVAVEPLAKRLGTTKGSFYWHFPHREALVAAALALWEQRSTSATIEALAGEADPAVRLRLLFTRVSGYAGQSQVEANLLAATSHELVGEVVRRVVQRRISYVVGLFAEVGFGKGEATRRGVLAYAAYVGHDELAARLPGALPLRGPASLGRYVDTVLDLLLRDAPERT